jgi:hypothetical protein
MAETRLQNNRQQTAETMLGLTSLGRRRRGIRGISWMEGFQDGKQKEECRKDSKDSE